MTDGFSVNLTALEQASAGVDGTLDQVDQLGVSAISHDAAHLGHPALASTLGFRRANPGARPSGLS
jgi:hypothetical protein